MINQFSASQSILRKLRLLVFSLIEIKLTKPDKQKIKILANIIETISSKYMDQVTSRTSWF